MKRRRAASGFLAASWLLSTWTMPAAAELPPARVVVAEVQQRELAAGQTFVGTVKPRRSSTVSSAMEGRVIELLVEEGDAVKRGDPLAKLRTTQLEIQLAAAKAEQALRRDELTELTESLPEQIEQARARMMAAKALQDFTQSRLKRTQTLFERRATSEDDLQDVTSAAEAAKQKYLEASSAWRQAVATREEKLAQARARLLIQQEAVRRLEDDIAEHTIRAPFNGYVTAEHTEVGQWIAKGDAVAEVVELDTVEVEAPVPESYASQLKLNTTARVALPALPGRSWSGPVVAIVPQADPRSRSFPVKVLLENCPGTCGLMLKPGMFARVTLPLGSRQNVLLVPKDAVVLGGRSPTVYVVDPMPAAPASPGGPPTGPKPDGMARAVPVELGAAVDEMIEVRGQLEPGERVVVEGNERLFPGRALIIAGDRE